MIDETRIEGRNVYVRVHFPGEAMWVHPASSAFVGRLDSHPVSPLHDAHHGDVIEWRWRREPIKVQDRVRGLRDGYMTVREFVRVVERAPVASVQNVNVDSTEVAVTEKMYSIKDITDTMPWVSDSHVFHVAGELQLVPRFVRTVVTQRRGQTLTHCQRQVRMFTRAEVDAMAAVMDKSPRLKTKRDRWIKAGGKRMELESTPAVAPAPPPCRRKWRARAARGKVGGRWLCVWTRASNRVADPRCPTFRPGPTPPPCVCCRKCSSRV